MTYIEKALDYIEHSRKHALEATTGLSEAQWRFKPTADCWSIAEILEHMVIVEERVLGPVRDQLAAAPGPEAGRDSQLLDRIVMEKFPDRSWRVKGPEVIYPTGQWTPAESLDRLSRNYERLREFVASTPDLRQHVLESAPLKVVTNGAHTTLDGLQFALAVAAHDERHVRQMEEVKADANYPQYKAAAR